jgi:hypothetical protein
MIGQRKNAMIKFAGTNERGLPVIGLGLSRENCKRLLAGQPIRISVDEIVSTIDAEIVLFAGETEAAMAKEFKKSGLIGPDTKQHRMHPDDPHGR